MSDLITGTIGEPTITTSFYKLPEIPPRSPWRCYLFGGTPQETPILWQPPLGGEPNWFWRKMQFLCFGNRWIKDKQ